ncbi:hypothetical protein ACLOJK_017365 [Asimina triloba]
MQSDFQHHRQQQQQLQLNSGLMRYRSAPSSLLANFVDGLDDGMEDLLRSTSPDAESMFARFMSGGGSGDSNDFRNIRTENQRSSSEFMAAIERETEAVQQQSRFSCAQQMMYQAPPPLPNNTSGAAAAAVDTSYRVVNSMGMESPAVKTGSNLVRQSSSPAGLFPHLTAENGTTD